MALAAFAIVALVAAAASLLGLGPELRSWLRFDFDHPRTLREFAAIAINNGRVVLLPLIGAAALPLVGRGRFVLDAVIALLAIGNCILVGLALAGYGARLAISIAAHGPQELGAMSLALAKYIHARATLTCSREGWARTSAGCVALLISAAATEVWFD